MILVLFSTNSILAVRRAYAAGKRTIKNLRKLKIFTIYCIITSNQPHTLQYFLRSRIVGYP